MGSNIRKLFLVIDIAAGGFFMLAGYAVLAVVAYLSWTAKESIGDGVIVGVFFGFLFVSVLVQELAYRIWVARLPERLRRFLDERGGAKLFNELSDLERWVKSRKNRGQ